MDAIVTSLKPDQIILFGSGARGELRDESDLDLLVIKETDDREQDEPVILPHGERDVDMLVSTKDSAEAARQYAGDVRGKALETGVTVYTREGFTPIETGPALVPQGKKVVRRTLYKPDHARDFLDRAERKWRTANTPQTHPADRCEYLQASMEQALKGLTIAQGRQITHSHNLNVLWDDAEKDGEKIAATRNDIQLENLTKYAGKYQYWNPTPGMPEKTWRATQGIGEDVLKHAREKILRPPVAQTDAPAAQRQPSRQLRLVHQLLIDAGHPDHRPRAVELRPGPPNAPAVHHGRHRELRREGELVELFAVPLDVVPEQDLLDQQPLAHLGALLHLAGAGLDHRPKRCFRWACRQRRDRGTADT